MSHKKEHRSANEYLQYLKRELSNRERHAFEKGLEADPFEQEAMEGLEPLDSEQAEQDMLYLHNRLRRRLSRRRRVAFYSVAATMASLLIVGTVFLKIHDFNPGSDEKQVYPEESFDTSTPQEAQPVPPAQKETDISEPISPTPERTVPMPQAAPMKEGEPAKDAPKGRSKGDPEIKVVDLKDEEPDETEAYDFVMAEEPMAEEPITHMEAEPMARAGEYKAAPTTQKSGKRKKSLAQPVAQSPQEISNVVANDREVEQMLTGKVTGIVISAEDQEPIPGAIVENRALSSGVFTDWDGQFDIPVQEDTPTTLVASFIGMETQEYQVSDGAHVELIMLPDATTLDEVVVVGYLAQEEKKGMDYSVPEPAIGYKNYKQYVEQNIEFPQENEDLKRAIVVLKFKVTRTGEIKEVVALKSPGEAFTREAARLLMEGPSWNPASTDKGTKDESVRMRIVFKK